MYDDPLTNDRKVKCNIIHVRCKIDLSAELHHLLMKQGRRRYT